MITEKPGGDVVTVDVTRTFNQFIWGSRVAKRQLDQSEYIGVTVEKIQSGQGVQTGFTDVGLSRMHHAQGEQSGAMPIVVGPGVRTGLPRTAVWGSDLKLPTIAVVNGMPAVFLPVLVKENGTVDKVTGESSDRNAEPEILGEKVGDRGGEPAPELFGKFGVDVDRLIVEIGFPETSNLVIVTGRTSGV